MRKLPFVARCAVGAALLTLGSASVAGAASSVSITVGTDPAESITTQLGATVSGAGKYDRLSVDVKPAGGEGCAANPSADKGRTVISDYYSTEGAPAFSDASNYTFETAGSYLLCGWLVEGESPYSVLANPSMTISVRRPHLALSILAPQRVIPGQTFQVSTSAQAETSRLVWEYMLPDTGDSCPANANAAQDASGANAVLDYWNVTGGPFTETKNETLTSLGTYLVCAYFEYPNRESAPELTASVKTVVAAPSPPCVVPSFSTRMRLSTVERRIRAAHCTVGKIRYSSSVRYRRGSVIKLSPKSGTRLSSNAAVGVRVSSGPPRHHKR